MKKSFYIGILPLLFGAATLWFTSCDGKDDPAQEVKAIAPTVSALTIDVKGSVSFTDNSTGVQSRTWTFPGGTPATSTGEKPTVTFNSEGPVIVTLVDKFTDGTTKAQTLKVQVGTELMQRYSAGFEGDTCLVIWSYWCSTKADSAAYQISVDKTGGANGSSRCLKIVVNSPGHEIQLFSVPKSGVVNDFSLGLSATQKYNFSYWVKSTDFIGYVDSDHNNGQFNHDVVSKSSDDKVVANRQEWKDYAWGNMAISSTWTQVTQSFGPKDYYKGERTKNGYAFFKLIPTKVGTLYIDEVSIKPAAN